MQHLKDLIQMGFSPMVALVIVAIIILWGTLCAVVFYVHRSQIREREDRDKLLAERDKLRAQWHADIEERLTSSEAKHQACEEDRSELRTEIDQVKNDLDRMKRCPRRDCPMRLPG